MAARAAGVASAVGRFAGAIERTRRDAASCRGVRQARRVVARLARDAGDVSKASGHHNEQISRSSGGRGQPA
jgi:hypothetical protein